MEAVILDDGLNENARTLYKAHCQGIWQNTDRLFCWLMAAQWAFGIFASLVISPRTWTGTASQLHVHVYAAVFLGGLISAMPIAMARLYPGQVATRQTIAVSQMLWSALLIHLTGGRIETHFHVFGSLAFLAFYRDWKVLATATLVVALDHMLRGMFWPESVFGVVAASNWRWMEHAAWVIFEDAFLVPSCLRSVKEMKDIALRQATIEAANEITEREVTLRTEALRVAVQAAESANHAKSAFLANMSHEIRTPMNGIIGMSELLRVTPLSEQQENYATTIQSSADSLLAIINDILDFSKIEAGKMEIESVPFDLVDVIEQVGSLCSMTAHKKGLELLHSIPLQAPHLVGDPVRVRQVLTNLVGNAIKFTSKGEISIIVEIESQNENLAYLKISVVDTGIGIPADRIDAVFESFTQADNTTTRRFGGTGLGLTISRRLVELMGGSIGVLSEPGIGSEFWIRLALPISSQQLPFESANMDSLKKLRALVVDDNATNRELLAANLTAWAVRFDSAESGAEALELIGAAKNDPYDLILMDHHMPDMDGMTTTERINQMEGRTPKVLILSSGLNGEDQEAFAKLGVETCLLKPFRQSELVRALLRAASVAEEPAAARAGVDELPQLGLSVLLAEDNVVNQKVAEGVLKRLGCSVVTVANGREAIEATASQQFDAILMDVQMPELDGLEATRLIRESEAKSGGRLPIIAMTAGARDRDRMDCMEAGMDDYLSKPFKQAQLLAKLSPLAAKRGTKTPRAA